MAQNQFLNSVSNSVSNSVNNSVNNSMKMKVRSHNHCPYCTSMKCHSSSLSHSYSESQPNGLAWS